MVVAGLTLAAAAAFGSAGRWGPRAARWATLLIGGRAGRRGGLIYRRSGAGRWSADTVNEPAPRAATAVPGPRRRVRRTIEMTIDWGSWNTVVLVERCHGRDRRAHLVARAGLVGAQHPAGAGCDVRNTKVPSTGPAPPSPRPPWWRPP